MSSRWMQSRRAGEAREVRGTVNARLRRGKSPFRLELLEDRVLMTGGIFHTTYKVFPFAGPGGGTAEKPVGLVWFALALQSGETETRRLTFPGNRADIRDRATMAALGLIWRHLERDAHASTAP